MPANYEHLPDVPCDESSSNFDTHSEDSVQISERILNANRTNPERKPLASNPNPITADFSNQAESVPPKRKTKTKSIVGFDHWYGIYPRKVARGSASKAYRKAISEIAQAYNVSTEQAVSLLLRWTQERLQSVNATETKFRPHPARWLNDERYRDEIAAGVGAVTDALADYEKFT